MVDVVLRTQDWEEAKEQLLGMGITLTVPEEGQTIRIEGELGVCQTPLYTDVVDGDIYFTVRLSDEEAAIINGYIIPPDVHIDWRSDEWFDSGEVDEAGEPILEQGPIPTYTAYIYDEEGNATGKRQQQIGIIKGNV